MVTYTLTQGKIIADLNAELTLSMATATENIALLKDKQKEEREKIKNDNTLVIANKTREQ